MPRFRDDDIAAVRQAADLVAVVSEYCTLTRSGDRLKGLCPLHDEKTPSFHVRPAHGTYHCFGCGEGGDVIAFLMHPAISRATFPEAVWTLSEQFGVQLHDPDDNTDHGDDRRRLIQANEAAAGFYAQLLRLDDEAQSARDFLLQRHFDVDASTRFGCGYAPLRSKTLLINHLREKGFTIHEMVQAGLVHDRGGKVYDVYRGRLLWSIRDQLGRATGFAARRLRFDDPLEAKYLNTANTKLFSKSHVLYGLDLARKTIAQQRHVVIVEGYTDVMAMHDAGVTNTVASCGTALTSEHITMLRRLVGEQGEITFVLDSDEAGQKATMNTYKLACRSIHRLSVAHLPDASDPEETRRNHGNAALRECVEQRTPLVESVLAATLATVPANTPEDRAEAIATVQPIFAEISDSLLWDQYARWVAEQLNVPSSEVLPRLRTSRDARQQPSVSSGHVDRGAPHTWLEKEALRVVLHAPHVLDRNAEQLLNSALYQHPVAQDLLPLLRELHRDSDTAASASWTHAVLNMITEQQRSAVLSLIAEPFIVPTDQCDQYADELVTKLQIAALTRDIDSMRDELRQTDDPDRSGRLLDALTELRQSRAACGTRDEIHRDPT